MLEKLPSIVTISTLAALCLVVSHEWAYFGVIGSEYQALYTTADYITLLVWGSGAIFLAVVIFGGIQLVAFRRDNFEFPPFSQKKTLSGFIDRQFPLVVLVPGAAFHFFFGTSQVNLVGYLLFSYIVFLGLLYIFRHERTVRFDAGWYALLIYGLPIGMILLYGFGKYSAYADISDRTPHYELRLREKWSGRSINILRFLEKGVIIFDPQTKAVEFIGKDMIASVTRRASQLDERSFACKYWQFMCASRHLPQQ